jgi:hypothetical protein
LTNYHQRYLYRELEKHICRFGEIQLNIQNVNNYGATEVVGAILIIIIAVVVSAFIYTQILPFDIPTDDTNVHIMGNVQDDGYLVLEHMGGATLDYYEILLTKNDETQLVSFEDDPWEIGEQIRLSIETLPGFEYYDVHVTIFAIDLDDSRQMIFDAELSPSRESGDDPEESNETILISTFRTNSPDEDLLCCTEYLTPNIDPKSYIYNWIVNNNPLEEVILPFDTNNVTLAKDYSGYENDGIANDVIWTANGKVGGAYYFDGGGSYISIPTTPNVLLDISNNDFTYSIWVYSEDIAQDHRLIFMGGNSNKNFITLFQMGSEIHFGVSENGTKHCVRTDNLESNTWYHIVGTWDADQKTSVIYSNGIPSYETGYRTYSMGLQDGLDLGHGTASSRFWWGYMDDFRLYNRKLSTDQIYQLYMSNLLGIIDYDVIVSKETRIGEVWKCIITPNNAIIDDLMIVSNSITITNYLGGD